MDVLCIENSQETCEKLKGLISSLGFDVDCVVSSKVEKIKKILKDETPPVVVSPKDMEIDMGKDTLIFLVGECQDERCLTMEYSEEFKIRFMQGIYKASIPRVKELLKKRDVRKNMVYVFGLSWGHTFIVDVSREREIRKILPKMANEDIYFFIAVRERPEEYRRIKNSKVVWVTDIVGKDRIKPHNLTILTDSIIRYIEEFENAIVMIDCVEYLLLYNDFVNILRNIELINSYVMEHGSLMIIVVDSKAYTTKEYSLLSRYAIEWKGV